MARSYASREPGIGQTLKEKLTTKQVRHNLIVRALIFLFTWTVIAFALIVVYTGVEEDYNQDVIRFVQIGLVLVGVFRIL